MTSSQAPSSPKPLQKLDRAVIAGPRTRLTRARAFQFYVLGVAALFIVLAFAANAVPYFALDLRITRAIQAVPGPLFHGLMIGLSWIGFMPQADVLAGFLVVALYLMGLRWEAMTTLFAAAAVIPGVIIKMIVLRPRPTSDLVRVLGELASPSFPSGHVLSFTVVCGFLMFLAYTLLRPSWGRTLMLITLGLVVGLMGVSRIYLGQHWFSDVVGGYLFGSLWLALTIKIYRWGKPRFFVDQPVARVAPAGPSGSAAAS